MVLGRFWARLEVKTVFFLDKLLDGIRDNQRVFGDTMLQYLFGSKVGSVWGPDKAAFGPRRSQSGPRTNPQIEVKQSQHGPSKGTLGALFCDLRPAKRRPQKIVPAGLMHGGRAEFGGKRLEPGRGIKRELPLS